MQGSSIREAQRRGDAIAVRLERFQSERGDYPAALEELEAWDGNGIGLPPPDPEGWHYAKTGPRSYALQFSAGFGGIHTLQSDGDRAWRWVEDLATAASEPIPLGHPGFVLTPFVLGPGLVPVVTDPVAADADPELAVLSAMAHGSDEPELAFRVAVAAVAAAGRLDEERAKLYIDLVLSRVRGAAKAALEELMQSGKYEYQSDFARKYIAMGKAEGRAEGVAQGLATSVLNVLTARGLVVPDSVRARVLGCDDVATLERWVTRAVTVSSAEELIGEPA
jgi:hypothetical protein